MDDQDAQKYTTIRTDLLAGMGFPTADVARFETYLMWLYWAFSVRPWFLRPMLTHALTPQGAVGRPHRWWRFVR